MTMEDRLEISAEIPLLGSDDYRELEEQRGDDRFRSNSISDPWCCGEECLRLRVISMLASPDDDIDKGFDGCHIFLRLTSLAMVGALLGLIIPHNNSSLPTPWYRPISSSIGYTYFLSWSVSFYPQVVSNFARKSTQGLSTDFCALNTVGFVCYAIYNLAFFWSTLIQELYKERHGGSDVTVQSNDVAFAVHALVLSSITWMQVGFYHGIRSMVPSRIVVALIILILITIGGYVSLVVVWKRSTWLDFLYFLSYIKVFVSLIKYTPQVWMNSQLQSTKGWSIWNILLDLTGGILSVVQLTLDCADMNDWTGITGNAAKFVLGNVSIFFDVIFVLQHYVFYRNRPVSEASPLLAHTASDSNEEEKREDNE